MRRSIIVIAMMLVGMVFLWPIASKMFREVFFGDMEQVHADRGFAPELFATLPTDSSGATLLGDHVIAGIVPHHLVSAPSLAEFFEQLSLSAIVPKRIILVGPNHYERGRGKVIVGRFDWETPFGIARVDEEFSDALIRSEIAVSDDVTLDDEHALFSVIPFIRRFLPDAAIVPIAVSGTLSPEESLILGKKLAAQSDDGTIIVGSIDFSHYLSSKESDQRDRETLAAIRSEDIRAIAAYGNEHIDSVPALLAVLAYAKEYEARPNSLRVLRHTNSGDITKHPNSPGTSHFTMAFVSGRDTSSVSTLSTNSDKKELLFGGDMMFDRWIRTMMRKHGDSYPIEPLREKFVGADAVIANLEGPITGNDSISEASTIGSRENYVFTFDSSVAGLLKEFNVIASLGNNHILNWKEEGARETEDRLREAKVEFFGSPRDGAARYLVHNFSGFRVSFVNYNQFVQTGREKAVEDIKNAKAVSDFVVLYAHWGEEYESATEQEKVLSREFVDAGADIVIGSHPHIVQEREIYHGKTIYYSLGNLVFDQYFREDTKHGLLLEVSIDPTTKVYTTEEIPIMMEPNGQTKIRNGLSSFLKFFQNEEKNESVGQNSRISA